MRRAVLRGADRAAYADQLVRLARRFGTRQTGPLLSMANRSDLTTRVAAVLNGGQARGRVGLQRTLSVTALATVGVLAIAPLAVVGDRVEPRLMAPSPPVAVSGFAPALEAASVNPDKSADANSRAVRVQRQATPVQASSATVAGIIVDVGGVGVPDAAVVLTDIGTGPDDAARTDQAGRFEFVGLPNGQYLIGVSAPGLEPFHDRLTVIRGEKMQLNITLHIRSLVIITSAGRPAPSARGPQGRPPLPNGWTCLDVDVRAVGEGLCGPPSLVQELARDVPERLEAFRKQAAKPAAMPLSARLTVRYPQDLWDAMIEGSVVLEGRVGTDGSPVGLNSIAPVHPGLAKEALETVSQRRFEPAQLHDVAVEAPLRVTINFRLHNAN